MNNYAFIDGNNLHLSLRNLKWRFDYRSFRKYLKDKYKISKAFYFIGKDPKNQWLYQKLTHKGYIMVFKEIDIVNGHVKGNCDAELILHTMIQKDNFDKAVLVTGDGDFQCLVKYLEKENKLIRVIGSKPSFSYLLKKVTKKITFLEELETKVGIPNAENKSRRSPRD